MNPEQQTTPGLSPLDAAMEAVGGVDWADSWNAAAAGNLYRRGLLLSTALQAAEDAIKAGAEAKLAAIEALCHRCAEQVRADYPGAGMAAVPVSAGSILAIINGGESAGGAA